MGTQSTPEAVASADIRTAESALNIANSGPPKSPTCCPVTTQAAPLRNRARFVLILSLEDDCDALPPCVVIAYLAGFVLRPLLEIRNSRIKLLYTRMVI